MSRESSRPGRTDSPEGSEVKELAEALVYVPSTVERKLKAKFWAKAQDNPLMSLDGSSVTLALVKQTAGGGTTLDGCWKKPGFKDWFLNPDDGRAKLEYLFDLGLDAMEELLLSPDPKTSAAKVNALKLLSELTGRYIKGRQGQVGGLGEAIASADKASLEALFQSAGLTVAVSASKGHQDESTIATIDVANNYTPAKSNKEKEQL